MPNRDARVFGNFRTPSHESELCSIPYASLFLTFSRKTRNIVHSSRLSREYNSNVSAGEGHLSLARESVEDKEEDLVSWSYLLAHTVATVRVYLSWAALLPTESVVGNRIV